MAIDLSDVWGSVDTVDRLLSQITTAYARLEVDLVVLAYAARLVRLSGGRDVLLHFTTVLKDVDDPVDEAFWNRVLHLTRNPLALPGTPAHFHPLALQDVIHQIERAGRRRSHSYHALVWWARRWLDEPERFSAPEFLMRVADNVDYQMHELGRTLDGTLDTLAVFLATALKSHGRPGGFVSQVMF